jgi:hypothetical protein
MSPICGPLFSSCNETELEIGGQKEREIESEGEREGERERQKQWEDARDIAYRDALISPVTVTCFTSRLGCIQPDKVE